MKQKKYFKDMDSEYCFSKQYWLDYMKEFGIEEMTVIEAVPIRNSEFFFCRAVDEMGEKGSCGKICPDYEPRNGKSGMCKHKGFVYEPTDEVKLILT